MAIERDGKWDFEEDDYRLDAIRAEANAKQRWIIHAIWGVVVLVAIWASTSQFHPLFTCS